MQLLARSVLCVFLGCFISIDAAFVAPNLEFMNDPNFPGNAGWQKKLDQQLSFTKDPNFPGNAGWQNNLQESLSFRNDPMFPGNPGFQETISSIPVPHFPKNFPFPPECNPTAYPGFPYPEVNIVTTSNVKPTIEHESFLCRDPEFSPDSFYMLKTIVNTGPQSKDTRIIYYNKQGEVIQYAPKVEIKPFRA